MTTVSATRLRVTERPAVRAALDRAVARLVSLAARQGWWKGELATNVTIEAEDLLLRQVLGVADPEITAATARWIRAQQRADGTWATYYGGPGDLSTTVEAYLALRLAGDPPAAEHLRAAAAWARDRGGLAATRVFTRCWLALVGQWPWAALPPVPPEVMLLPARGPASIYDLACWARQTIVPLSVVWAHRPVYPLGVRLGELGGPPPPRRWRFPADPVPPLRRLALDTALSWVLRRQEADGSWGGIQPPWVYSLLALHVSGYPVDHPAMAAGLAGLDRFTVLEAGPHGPVRRLEACQSPVWDTALAVLALRDAGLASTDPLLVRAARWLAAEEVRVPGDWQLRRPRLSPGGWAFEFANDGYPDVDDTALVVLALRRVAAGPAAAAAADRGVAWARGMASRDGGWGAFDADNMRRWPTRLPFCDFGEVVDPPSADVTAHVIEMLAAEGRAADPVTRAGVDWLLRHQEGDGSWFGRWGVNHVYGTAAVLPALAAAGFGPDHPAMRAGHRWLVEHQQSGGAFGEDVRSYTDPAWRGRGAPTASQTAWGLIGLLAAGERGEPAHRAASWLVAAQRPDGGWDEPEYTGTGFPGDFAINYGLYRLVFPISALGRYLAAR